MDPEPGSPARRTRGGTSLGMLMLAVAMIAANLTLFVHVRDDHGWGMAAAMLGTNVVLSLLMGLVARMRAIAILGTMTMAALTEGLLLPSARMPGNGDWIIAVAVVGALFVLACDLAVRAARRPRR